MLHFSRRPVPHIVMLAAGMIASFVVIIIDPIDVLYLGQTLDFELDDSDQYSYSVAGGLTWLVLFTSLSRFGDPRSPRFWLVAIIAYALLSPPLSAIISLVIDMVLSGEGASWSAVSWFGPLTRFPHNLTIVLRGMLFVALAAWLRLPATGHSVDSRRVWLGNGVGTAHPGQVTRLLCASAFLDGSFRDKVIAFFRNETRAATPEIGFDARLVLIACQVARDRAKGYTILFSGVALLTLVLAGAANSPTTKLASVFLLGALSSAVYFYKAVDDRTRLIRPFRRDVFDAAKVAASYTYEKIDYVTETALPSQNQNLVVYADFLPFVGAGIDLGGWSFATFVNRAKIDGDGRGTIAFTIDELYSAVEAGMAAMNIPALRVEDWYFVSGTDVRGDSNILGDVARRPRQHLRQEAAEVYLRTNDPRVRHYKWIRIEGWGGELVVSLFLRCARMGESLFVETRQFLMAPLSDKYRKIDSLPERGVALYLPYLLVSLVAGPLMTVAAPFVIATWIQEAFSTLGSEEGRDNRFRRKMETLTQHNYGATNSLRGSLAQTDFRHYFQKSDTDLYRKVLERKLFDAIVTFLDAHEIDTSDIRERQTTILNSGVLVQGGNIHAESLAVGQGAISTKVEGVQPSTTH